MTRAVEGRAFAKINLGLRILDRREDGFHELRTIFQTISLADRLRVAYNPRGRTVRLDCDDPALAGEENLAVRAAHALLERTGRRGGVAITLSKRIPPGAGLGGGSSDAGAVLLALAKLIEPAPTPLELWETAASLGSDVPFFLVGGRAIGAGRGEEVYPLPEGPKRWLLLLTPRLHVATAEAYRALAQSRRRGLTQDRRRSIIASLSSGIGASGGTAAHEFAGAFSNDFEDVIFRLFPNLQELRERLEKAGSSVALMSGSGSALFGMFDARRDALRACARFGEFEGESFVASTIARGKFRDALKVVSS